MSTSTRPVRAWGGTSTVKEEPETQTPLEGFDVTVERVFHNDGKEVRREPFRTHYTPRDEITCETPR
ncbi:hypothetical protein [Streptomyces coeruleorubidus]